jgi:hypothetical protein
VCVCVCVLTCTCAWQGVCGGGKVGCSANMCAGINMNRCVDEGAGVSESHL